MLCVAGEPSFNEILRDPIIRAIMACDAVAETDLRRLVEHVLDAYQDGDEAAPLPA